MDLFTSQAACARRAMGVYCVYVQYYERTEAAGSVSQQSSHISSNALSFAVCFPDWVPGGLGQSDDTWPTVCTTARAVCQWPRPPCWLCRLRARQRWVSSPFTCSAPILNTADCRGLCHGSRHTHGIVQVVTELHIYVFFFLHKLKQELVVNWENKTVLCQLFVYFVLMQPNLLSFEL